MYINTNPEDELDFFQKARLSEARAAVYDAEKQNNSFMDGCSLGALNRAQENLYDVKKSLENRLPILTTPKIEPFIMLIKPYEPPILQNRFNKVDLPEIKPFIIPIKPYEPFKPVEQEYIVTVISVGSKNSFLTPFQRNVDEFVVNTLYKL